MSLRSCSVRLQKKMKVAHAFHTKFQLSDAELKALKGTRENNSIDKV